MTIAVVFPAAGHGVRMGSAVAKQYLEVAGRPVLAHTLAAFEGLVDQAVVAISPDAAEDAKHAIDCSGISYPVAVVHGGATRQESVHNGLRATHPSHEYVLVHDAARPLITASIIADCVAALGTSPAIVTATPCAATVKRVSDDGETVAETVSRHDLWLAQTPQGFQRTAGMAAFEQAAHEQWTCTDDAEVMERAGHTVRIVQGSAANIKLTTPDDLTIAAAILAARQ